MSRIIRIGSGSAWWGDRIEPAVLNAERGDLDYLCFETMAEATISAAQVRARRDPSVPGLRHLSRRSHAGACCPACLRRGTRIVSNQGWINPNGAAERIVELLRALGKRGVKVAAVSGGMITDRVLELTDTIMENGGRRPRSRPSLITAEVYLGAEPIVEALQAGAQIVVTGRVADPSIFMAPMMYEFGWDPLDHAPTRPGQRHRAPHGVRRAGHRRLLQRPRVQGRAGTLELRLPDRGGRGRRQRGDHARWPEPAAR